jgi:hypothetical protein
MKLPDSIQHLHGSLYLVPFTLIELPEPDGDKPGYQFQNPRSVTDRGQKQRAHVPIDLQMLAKGQNPTRWRGQAVSCIEPLDA